MDIIWIVYLALLGAVTGSFLNVLIYRLPRGESIVFPRSHCPSCGRLIQWYDNIPLLSWLLLGARCRRCKAPISPRYVIVEAATAIRVAGLFVCYYMLHLRRGAGTFEDTWPMFLSHAALLCGLLACAVIDAEHFFVPLEITWVCAAVGVAAAAFRPHPFWPAVAPATAAASLGALAGLAAAVLLVRAGFLQASFADAPEEPPPRPAKHPRASAGAGGKRASSRRPARGGFLSTALTVLVGTVTGTVLGYVPGSGPGTAAAEDVAATASHGVRPRKEVLREVLFLLPAGGLAVLAVLLLRGLPAVAGAWAGLFDPHRHELLGPRLGAVASVAFGYLIGGLWIWGTRIVFTLVFNKEAMGMGDVHIFAAVGAVTGWAVPSLAFLVAPWLALSWAIVQWIARRHTALAFGPWLATASMLVMIFYDRLAALVAALLGAGR